MRILSNLSPQILLLLQISLKVSESLSDLTLLDLTRDSSFMLFILESFPVPEVIGGRLKFLGTSMSDLGIATTSA